MCNNHRLHINFNQLHSFTFKKTMPTPEQQESQKRPAFLLDDLTRRVCFWRKEETSTNGVAGGIVQEQESQTRPAFLFDDVIRRVCFWRKEESVKVPGKNVMQKPQTEFDKILAEYEKDLKKDVAEQADAANKQKYTTAGNIFGLVLSPSKMKNSTKATSATNDPSTVSAQPINSGSLTASSSSASTTKQQKSRRRGIKTGRSSKNASTSVSTALGGGEKHDEVKLVDDIANNSRRSESETTTTSTDEAECSCAGRSDENKSTTCTSSWWWKVLLFLGALTVLTPTFVFARKRMLRRVQDEIKPAEVKEAAGAATESSGAAAVQQEPTVVDIEGSGTVSSDRGASTWETISNSIYSAFLGTSGDPAQKIPADVIADGQKQEVGAKPSSAIEMQTAGGKQSGDQKMERSGSDTRTTVVGLEGSTGTATDTLPSSAVPSASTNDVVAETAMEKQDAKAAPASVIEVKPPAAASTGQESGLAKSETPTSVASDSADIASANVEQQLDEQRKLSSATETKTDESGFSTSSAVEKHTTEAQLEKQNGPKAAGESEKSQIVAGGPSSVVSTAARTAAAEPAKVEQVEHDHERQSNAQTKLLSSSTSGVSSSGAAPSSATMSISGSPESQVKTQETKAGHAQSLEIAGSSPTDSDELDSTTTRRAGIKAKQEQSGSGTGDEHEGDELKDSVEMKDENAPADGRTAGEVVLEMKKGNKIVGDRCSQGSECLSGKCSTFKGKKQCRPSSGG
ncbi:unnamed protein product [Amoebophrya sp. A120]|nr:unnamed protein product [Amoebophrya sp. A120]|eukprot:GSA120T00024557001.1